MYYTLVNLGKHKKMLFLKPEGKRTLGKAGRRSEEID
jgi:hypothetical protein